MEIKKGQKYKVTNPGNKVHGCIVEIISFEEIRGYLDNYTKVWFKVINNDNAKRTEIYPDSNKIGEELFIRKSDFDNHLELIENKIKKL